MTLNNAGNSFSGSFAGNGAGVTNVNAAALNGLNATNFWQTTGNGGTTPGANFVGTTDTQPLELHVNGVRAMRLEPGASGAPNVVGGASVNFVTSGVGGATIGGGGTTASFGAGVRPASSNSVTANFGTVGGGTANTASGSFATIGGGEFNTNSGNFATVSGGAENIASGIGSYVGGGGYNGITFGGNSALGIASVIGGGLGNTASGVGSYVGGGGYDGTSVGGNTAGGNASVIGGGLGNFIGLNGNNGFIGGGYSNVVQGGIYPTGRGYCRRPAKPYRGEYPGRHHFWWRIQHGGSDWARPIGAVRHHFRR